MSTTRSFSKPFIQKNEDGETRQWGTASFAILSLAVLLAALVVYSAISVGENVAAAIDQPGYSGNPELNAARRYAQTGINDANTWAINPELKSVERYTAAAAGIEAGYGISNPELSAHQRFSGSSSQTETRSIEAVNPELKSVERYTAPAAGIEAGYGVSNPELSAHQRFSEASG